MALQKNKFTITLSDVISLLLLLAFIAVALSLVFSKGICCGDDAYLSVIAKNFANGLGYTSTIQPFVAQYTIRAYDPLVGTGPTIILPASIFIKVFGNTYWAPGLANVFLWSLLLICIGIVLRKQYHGIGLALFTFSFLYLAYSLMTYHFEHWYALLGEVPSVLLVLLGVLCFFYRDTRRNLFLAGVLFSLAFQAKLLTLIAIVVFLAAQAIVTYVLKPNEGISVFFKRSVYQILYVGIGFLIPFVIFELWKFYVMGSFEYIENWREFLKYTGDDGARLNQSLSLIQLYDARLRILFERFGILLPSLGLIVLLAWMMLREDERLRRLFLVLLSIITVYSFWWIFLSIGWARYFIICLILLIFTISLPLLASRSKPQAFLYLVLIVFFASNNWTRLGFPFEELQGKYFSPTVQTRSLLEVTRALSQESILDDRPIVTQWWATAADIEYAMDTSLNFTTYHDETITDNDVFWIAVNMRFVGKEDKDFATLLDECTDIKEQGAYMIAKCEFQASR